MSGTNIEASFTQFIGGFAVQTLVHLGKMSNPVTGGTAVDLPNAKYSIDILGILQDKTNGNLSEEEDEYLANLLRDLRMEYVTVLNRSGTANDEANESEEQTT
jgi:hypothetical protein